MGSRDKIIRILMERYGVDEAAASADATLTDLGLDSLSIAELVFDIEDEFGIEIKEEDVDFTTLGGAIELVDRYIEAKGG